MLLTVSIGNTNILIGVFENNEIIFNSTIKTDKNKTSDEYAISFINILNLYMLQKSKINGSIIASVVPKLNSIISKAIEKVTETTPLLVGPGVKTGLNIMIDNPSQLGADIAALAVGASSLYESPVIIFDISTATTITVLDKNNVLRGVSIMPGVSVSLDALIENTTLLPEISLEAPRDIIGTNSQDSMKSGIIYGTASMVDGMISRIEERIGIACSVVATGEFAPIILPYCKSNIIYNPNLLLNGLNHIYMRNCPKHGVKGG